MKIKFSPRIAPLISTVLFMLGNGYLTTFISIRMKELGHDEQVIGIVASAYYIGLVVGALNIAKLIVRMGHLRVYTIFVGLFNTVCLLHVLNDSIYLWFLLRFIAGVALSGFFITIESWLLECSNPQNRGTTAALYIVAISVAQSCSQLLLNKYSVLSLIPFIVITTFLSISVIPLAIAKKSKAQDHEMELISMVNLAKVASSSLVVCLVGGMFLSVIYSLLPIFFYQLTGNSEQTSHLMFTTFMGGMILQYPLGLLSDHFDRRKVIMGISVALVSMLSFITFVGPENISFTNLILVHFFLGGAGFVFYPMALSMVCDNLRSVNVVSVTQKLSMVEGFGSIIGPLVAPVFMNVWGIVGILIYFISITIILVLFLMYRVLHKDRVSNNNFFLAIPTTPIVSELDPRVDEEETQENKA